MANLSKLKKGRLGSPPPQEEASGNLQAPETAPEPTATPRRGRDFRARRRTHRTVQFATRVSPDFDEKIRRLAARDDLMLAEILEKAVDAYEKTLR